ncbi:MAG: hypothetical protein M1814_005819 [Vezdaea aestivalis]|nr:MAG: hypothetical protein M1814_005819 [Vezdaea aestivalis]
MELPIFLLLLPGLSDADKLGDIYSEFISSTFKSVAAFPNSSQSAARLDIGLLLPESLVSEKWTQSESYPYVQRALARIYSSACAVGLREGISTFGRGGVDVRILLLDQHSQQSKGQRNVYIVPALENLVLSQRLWTGVYSASKSALEALLTNFDREFHGHPSWKITNFENRGIDQATTPQRQLKHSTPHYVVALGGTFDHLHAGHKLLLTMAAYLVEPQESGNVTACRRLIVGISGDDLLKNKKFADYLESWDQRQMSVSNFLRSVLDFRSPDQQSESVKTVVDKSTGRRTVSHSILDNFKIECVEIQDAFGPTITDTDITALVVSAASAGGGTAVNERRKRIGWRPLEILEVDVLGPNGSSFSSGEGVTSDEMEKSKISSTDVRKQQHEQQRKVEG